MVAQRVPKPSLKALADLAQTPVTMAGEQLLGLSEPLAAVVPWGGLRRGMGVSVRGTAGLGSTSFALALLAEATQQGSWAALVGVPTMGLAAAQEYGVVLERVAVIDRPDPELWASATGALLGAFDLVVISPQHRLRPADQRRILARARERGTVIITVDAEPLGTSDLVFTVVRASWKGLGDGHGHLQSRQVDVRIEGRREASRPRIVRLGLPGTSGSIELIDDLDDQLRPIAAQRTAPKRRVVVPLVRETPTESVG